MKSVYIHIPFCSSICSYCGFTKSLYNKEYVKNYLYSLEMEIRKYYEGDLVDTIYIGGGTPSSLNKEELEKLFEIISLFNIHDIFEFTFECNINDINEELLLLLNKYKVNRLSIGVESFNEDNLKYLNRKHNKKEIFEKIKMVKEKYFDNINVDLIYALPSESTLTLKQDVKNILKLDIPHISTYSLMIEDNTLLKVKNERGISEELDREMYDYICKKLTSNGYIHYEVSNFAKEDFESKHNLKYWNNKEYYGFGLSSHGYINGIRYENTKNLDKYINGKYRTSELFLSKKEDMENYVMLGLRQLKGISLKDFYERYNENMQDIFNIKKAIKDKLIILDGEYIRIPEDKIYVMNEILNIFFE